MRRARQFLSGTSLSSLRPHAPYAGAGAVSAALLVLTFPSYSVWWVAFFGQVPFYLALYMARSWANVFWMGFTASALFILLGFGWVAFVATNFGGLPWIVGKLVLVIFSLFGEAQFLLFGLFATAVLRQSAALPSRVARALVALALLPVSYIAIDAVVPKIFPNTLGHVLYGWLTVAQAAELTGVFGLTLPIVVANAALAALAFRALPRRKLEAFFWRDPAGGPPGVSAKAIPGIGSALVALGAVALALAAADSWGRGRMAELAESERGYSRSLRFVAIQGNIGDIDKLASRKGFEPAVRKVLSTYREMTLESVRRRKPDLVIWPETAFPFLYTHLAEPAANRSGAARDAWIKDLVREIQTPLFFGTYSQQGRKDFNSAFLVLPPYELAGTYRKSILLAFGEYVPLGPLAPLVQDVVPAIANFGRGTGPVVMSASGVRLAPQICYEGIFPEHSRESVRMGADILLNITNDSWFGDGTEPWLHLLLTAFRTIETRRPMIRATNTGVSAVISMAGELRFRTRLFETGVIEAELRVPGPGQSFPTTFYLQHGELFAGLCLAVALLGAALLFAPLFQPTRR